MKADETAPFGDNQELLRNSGVPESALIVVGQDHRLADPESLKAMLETVEKVAVDDNWPQPQFASGRHRL